MRRASLEGLKRSRSTPTRYLSEDHRSASCAEPRRAVEVPWNDTNDFYGEPLQGKRASISVISRGTL